MEMASVHGIQSIVVSPNGETLALQSYNRADRSFQLSVVPASGGEIRELYRVEAPLALSGGPVAWTPDSKHLLFATWDTETNLQTLWKIALAGGAPTPVTGFPESAYLGGVKLSPDGTRAAFGWTVGRGEIWKIENLP